MEEYLLDFLKYGSPSLILTTIACLLLWKFVIPNLLDKEIEKYKSDLTKDRDKAKAELEMESDLIKHELSKEALISELLAKGTHNLYAALFKLLRIAEGSVGKLTGFQMVPTWKDMTDDEIRSFLSAKDARDRDIDAALSEIDREHNGFNPIHILSLQQDIFITKKIYRKLKTLLFWKSYIFHYQ